MKKYLFVLALALVLVCFNSCKSGSEEPVVDNQITEEIVSGDTTSEEVTKDEPSVDVPVEEEPDLTRSYTVYHYFENIDDDDYSSDETMTQTLTGMAGEATVAEANTVTGFNAKNIEQIILGDSDNQVVVYYDRVRTTVTFEGNGGTVTEENEEGIQEQLDVVSITGKYGQKVIVPDFKKTGFAIKQWNEEIPETFGLEDKSLGVVWSATASEETEYFIKSLTPKYVPVIADKSIVLEVRGGIAAGRPLIVWTEKPISIEAVKNQCFYLLPGDKEDVYRLAVKIGEEIFYFKEQKNTDNYCIKVSNSFNNPDFLNEFAVTSKLSESTCIQFIPVYKKEMKDKVLVLMKIVDSEKYITVGPSRRTGKEAPEYTLYGSDEPLVYLTTLLTDENGDVDLNQIFELALYE